MGTETLRGAVTLHTHDDDEPGGLSPPRPNKRIDSGSASIMTAGPMAAMPVASDAIERLAALLAAKENELRALQKTLDEYVASTGEYEKELEGELQRCEHKAAALEAQVQSLDDGKAQLQATLAQTQHELAVATKRDEVATAQVAEMKRTIQQLEQTNDELETATRVAQASIDELQHRVDTLTEENVFLLQEKEDALAALVAAKAEAENTGKDDEPIASALNGASAMRPEPSNSRSASRRKTPRLPEVVECCLHITCSHEQCRQVNPAAIAKATLVGQVQTISSVKAPKPTRRPFFERLRLRFFTHS